MSGDKITRVGQAASRGPHRCCPKPRRFGGARRTGHGLEPSA
jgi:hypothetical protein